MAPSMMSDDRSSSMMHAESTGDNNFDEKNKTQSKSAILVQAQKDKAMKSLLQKVSIDEILELQ